MDFVQHLIKASGKKFVVEKSPAGNAYDVRLPNIEDEVYCTYFDPEEKSHGIDFFTGINPESIADRETTKRWFEEFRSKLVRGYVPQP
jgi:hypothetical protein